MINILSIAGILFFTGNNSMTDTIPQLKPVKPVINTNIAFRASVPVDFIDLTASVQTVLPFSWITYSYGNGWSKDQVSFTAPLNGIYHFDVQLDGEVNNVKGVLILTLYKNGSYECESDFNLNNTVYCRTTFTSSCDMQLKKGDVVQLKAKQTTNGVRRFYGNSVRTYFSGHLVFAL